VQWGVNRCDTTQVVQERRCETDSPWLSTLTDKQDFVKQILKNQHENRNACLLQLFPPNYGLHKIRNVKQNSISPVFKPFSFFCSILRLYFRRLRVPTKGLLLGCLLTGCSLALQAQWFKVEVCGTHKHIKTLRLLPTEFQVSSAKNDSYFPTLH